MNIGDEYFIVADWTAKGNRVELCTWQNDLVDNNRVREGRLFETRQEAEEFLKNS